MIILGVVAYYFIKRYRKTYLNGTTTSSSSSSNDNNSNNTNVLRKTKPRISEYGSAQDIEPLIEKK